MDGWSTEYDNGNIFKLLLLAFISMGIGKEISSKYQMCLLRVNISRLQIKCECNKLFQQKMLAEISLHFRNRMNKHAQTLHVCTYDLFFGIELCYMIQSIWMFTYPFICIRSYASHLLNILTMRSGKKC